MLNTENTLTVCRPAWLQDDLNAYRHLHLTKTIVEDHFVKSEGFASKRDLQLVEGNDE